jgi:hypothetical protein
MPADTFQITIWTDEVMQFRIDPLNRDTSGNVTGATRIMLGPGFDLHGKMIGKLYSTPNFDVPNSSSMLGQHKEQNIMTSDVWVTDPEADIRVGDYLYCLTTMPNQWRKVAGISNARIPIANYCEAFLSLCDAPVSVIMNP